MINFLKREWAYLVIVLGMLLAAAFIYPSMPDQVPIHWNAQGVVDGYGTKGFGTFMLPVMNFGFYFLFLAIPILDPQKANYAKFAGSFRLIRFVFHLFFALIFALTIYASLGHSVDISLWVPAAVSILFIILGNRMGRVRHNYFVGFRLPWTLANEEVWQRTHRFGSKAMVIGGILSFIGIFLTTGNARFAVLMIGVMGPTILVTIYSYVIFKRMNG